MITSIKGFDKTCPVAGFSLRSVKPMRSGGKVKACSNGFHSCPSDEDTSPLSVFEYYRPQRLAIAKCRLRVTPTAKATRLLAPRSLLASR